MITRGFHRSRSILRLNMTRESLPALREESLSLLRTHGSLSAAELSDRLGTERDIVDKVLRQLIEQGDISSTPEWEFRVATSVSN